MIFTSSRMLLESIVCYSCWLCFVTCSTVAPLVNGERKGLRNRTQGEVAKAVVKNISPIIIACVLLSLALLVVLLVTHFIRTGSCRRIIDSFKLTNYQLKLSLPNIRLKERKIKSSQLELQSLSRNDLLEHTKSDECEESTEILVDNCDELEDVSTIKRSSRLFDALKTSLNRVDRHSSILTTSNKHLLIVHKEVESFEEEALSLLSNVMLKHLVDVSSDAHVSTSNDSGRSSNLCSLSIDDCSDIERTPFIDDFLDGEKATPSEQLCDNDGFMGRIYANKLCSSTVECNDRTNFANEGDDTCEITYIDDEEIPNTYL